MPLQDSRMSMYKQHSNVLILYFCKKQNLKRVIFTPKHQRITACLASMFWFICAVYRLVFRSYSVGLLCFYDYHSRRLIIYNRTICIEPHQLPDESIIVQILLQCSLVESTVIVWLVSYTVHGSLADVQMIKYHVTCISPLI